MRELVQGVLASFGLGPLATDRPTTPVDSPVGWAVLALVRSRRFGQAVTEEASNLPRSATLTSQTLDDPLASEDLVFTDDGQQTFALMATAAATNSAAVCSSATRR